MATYAQIYKDYSALCRAERYKLNPYAARLEDETMRWRRLQRAKRKQALLEHNEALPWMDAIPQHDHWLTPREQFCFPAVRSGYVSSLKGVGVNLSRERFSAFLEREDSTTNVAEYFDELFAEVARDAGLWRHMRQARDRLEAEEE